VSGTKKNILHNEIPVLNFARECVVATKDIAPGEVISTANVWVKRPGTGEIPAKHLKKVLGKKAKVAIKYDSQLKWADVE